MPPITIVSTTNRPDSLTLEISKYYTTNHSFKEATPQH